MLTTYIRSLTPQQRRKITIEAIRENNQSLLAAIKIATRKPAPLPPRPTFNQNEDLGWGNDLYAR